MNLLQDTLTVTLVDVQEVRIHGSLYYQVAYRTSDSSPIQQARINPEAFYPDPKPGDTVKLNLLMGNIMGAEKIA